MVKKFVFAIFILLGLSFQVFAETVVYDLDRNFKYRIDENGQVYDAKQKCKARIVDNKVYDNTFNRMWLVIDGSTVYDGKERPKFRIEGNKVYDAKGELKYTTEGDPIEQCKWNAKRLVRTAHNR
jgi:hypothetical protein